MKTFTFVNYDPSHRGNSRQDISVINTHVASRQRKNEDAATGTDPDGFITFKLPLLDTRLGGVRTDPFNAFPIPNKGLVADGFDYYTQIYAPLALHTGNFLQRQARTTMYNLLESPMFFESVISMMLMVQNIHLDRSRRTSAAISYHANNAIIRLREKLLSPAEMYSDIVIMSICSLAISQRLACNDDAFVAHIRGLQIIVAARGGIEKLGWHGFVQTAVRGLFESWDVLRIQQLQRWANPHDGHKSLTTSRILPPTPPHNLPPGFERLRSASQLELPLLNFLHVTFWWLARLPRSPHSITELTHEILSEPHLSTTERLIAITLQAYLNYLERTDQAWSNAATEHSVQVLIPALSQKTCLAECDGDVLAWSCLMIHAATERGTNAWEWADRMIERLDVGDGTRERLGNDFVRIPIALRSIISVTQAFPMSHVPRNAPTSGYKPV